MRISDWSSDVCSSDLEVVDRLKPLATEGNPWFGSAGEMVAIAYMKMRKPELSGPLFAAMSKDRSVPETIRTRAVQMAGLLGVDAVKTDRNDNAGAPAGSGDHERSEEHTSELQSLMRISYAV